MRPRILGVLLLTAMSSGLVCSSCSRSARPSGERPREQLFTVSRGQVRLGLRTTGSLRPHESVPVPSQIRGKIEWLIDEGTRVNPGDVIARVEDVEYRDELEDARSNLSIVQAGLALEELKRDYTGRDRQRGIRRAELELELAEIELAQLGAPAVSDVQASELDLELKRLLLESARSALQRLEGLAAKGIVDQHQISVAKIKLEGARVAHAKAVLEHDHLLAVTPEADLAVPRQNVQRARTALDLARKKMERDVNLCKTAVAVAQASVDRYKQTIDTQQRRVNDAAITAPIAGTVLYPRPWGSPPRLGDQIWSGNRILDIADLDTMAVEALVNQVDWPQIKTGQPVEIVLTAAPHTTFSGAVLNVGGLASDRYLTLGGDVTGVMTFPVVVLINDKSPLLRPTYSAHLNIITEVHDDVCWVPRTAIDRDDAGRDIVWLRRSGRTVAVPVTLGSRDALRVIVTDGLKAGDVVVVPTRK